MRSIRALFGQTVDVETLLGAGAYGEKYAEPVTVPCYVNNGNKLVRDAKGAEVVATATLYAPIEDADTFVPGSKVTIAGRVARVIAMNPRDGIGPAAAHHTEVHLT